MKFYRKASGFLFEVFLAYAAERTFPVIGKVCKRGSGLDSVIGIADFFVVDVTADSANKFSHNTILLFLPFASRKAAFINVSPHFEVVLLYKTCPAVAMMFITDFGCRKAA
jgi:hypothetical protein